MSLETVFNLISTPGIIQTTFVVVFVPVIINLGKTYCESITADIYWFFIRIFKKHLDPQCSLIVPEKLKKYQNSNFSPTNNMYLALQYIIVNLMKERKIPSNSQTSSIIFQNGDSDLDMTASGNFVLQMFVHKETLEFLNPKELNITNWGKFGFLKRFWNQLTSKIFKNQSHVPFYHIGIQHREAENPAEKILLKSLRQKRGYQSISEEMEFLVTIYGVDDNSILYTVLKSVLDVHNKHTCRSKNDRLVTIITGLNQFSERYATFQSSLDKLLLTPELSFNIRADLDQFLSARDWYTEIGQPYRRSYLLCGSPGCGKTSIIKAISKEYELNVVCLNLTSSTKLGKTLEEMLTTSMRYIGKRSMWVIEDIDCASLCVLQRPESQSTDSNEKDDQAKKSVHTEKHTAKQNADLSVLLNAVDGLQTPEGLLIVYTTNYPEKLDKALTRPGRVDRIWKLGPVLDKTVIMNYAKKVLGYPPSEELIDFVISQEFTPASVVGILMQMKNQPNNLSGIQIAKQFLIERDYSHSKVVIPSHPTSETIKTIETNDVQDFVSIESQ